MREKVSTGERVREMQSRPTQRIGVIATCWTSNMD